MRVSVLVMFAAPQGPTHLDAPALAVRQLVHAPVEVDTQEPHEEVAPAQVGGLLGGHHITDGDVGLHGKGGGQVSSNPMPPSAIRVVACRTDNAKP